NNDSYGPASPTSEICMRMTRMRATALGPDVIHAAVSGKSALIDHTGEFASAIGGSCAQALTPGPAAPGPASLYCRSGDVLMIGAAAAAVAVWWRGRTVVVSDRPAREEE